MEIDRRPPPPSCVIMAYDATKLRNEHEFKVTFKSVQTRGDILRGGDTIVVLGVLHRVTHPSKYYRQFVPHPIPIHGAHLPLLI